MADIVRKAQEKAIRETLAEMGVTTKLNEMAARILDSILYLDPNTAPIPGCYAIQEIETRICKESDDRLVFRQVEPAGDYTLESAEREAWKIFRARHAMRTKSDE